VFNAATRTAWLLLLCAGSLVAEPGGKRPGYFGAQLEEATVEGVARVRIVRVLPDGPAAAAGLKDGFRHPAHAEDCAMAFAWLAKRFPGHALFVSGHSCGAHLAALLALDPRYLARHGLEPAAIRGVVPIGGGYDLVKYHAILADGVEGEAGLGREKADAHLRWIFGDTVNDWIAASPATYLAGCRIPMLVVAEREPSMRRYTQDFEAAVKAAGVTSVRFRYMTDRTHAESAPLMSRKGPDPVRDEAIAFLEELAR